MVVDNDDVIQYVNPMLNKMLGYEQTELIGKVGYATLILPKDRDVIIQKNKERMEKKPDHYEIPMLRKDGSIRIISLKASPIEDSQGVVIGSMAICMDITAQKESEAKVTRLLKEKEILLREVHHRIKNNMSAIRAFLSFQASTLTEPSAITAIKEAEGRIISMMMIYNKLYRSENYQNVNAGEYLKELLSEICGTINLPEWIEVRTSFEEILIETEILYPLGIIVNELITNSVKYAFPESRNGNIYIGFRDLGAGICELVYRDNGIGFYNVETEQMQSGFGLDLIGLLIDQINAEAEVITEDGVLYKIRIKYQKA